MECLARTVDSSAPTTAGYPFSECNPTPLQRWKQHCASLYNPPPGQTSVRRETMARAHSESSEDFEFIETPAAPAATAPPEECGVRRTAVSWRLENVARWEVSASVNDSVLTRCLTVSCDQKCPSPGRLGR